MSDSSTEQGQDALATSVRLGLDMADADSDSEIARIVASHLSSRGRAMPDYAGESPGEIWDADYFGLQRVKFFRQANADLQREILEGCARTLLNEAYFIEKSGTAYCAKMILLAESTELRQVYGLIAADEASHLQWIRPWVAEQDRVRPDGAMLRNGPGRPAGGGRRHRVRGRRIECWGSGGGFCRT